MLTDDTPAFTMKINDQEIDYDVCRKIVEYNNDQLKHIKLVQELTQCFCVDLMKEANSHDASKFHWDEYWGFIHSLDSLKQSKTGQDEQYQAGLKSYSIQKHVTSNFHHPEYWTTKGEEMPVIQAIICFFDWYSRCLQNNTKFSDFWDYNAKKLERHPTALAIITNLKNYYRL